jgi:hypothetical protein
MVEFLTLIFQCRPAILCFFFFFLIRCFSSCTGWPFPPRLESVMIHGYIDPSACHDYAIAQ